MEDNIKLVQLEYWGPSKDYIFEDFKYLPFAPFSRLEKLGRISDFSQKIDFRGAAQGDQAQDLDQEFQEVQSKSQLKSKTNYPQQIYRKKPVQVKYTKPTQYIQQPQTQTQYAQGKKQQLNANRMKVQGRTIKTKFKESSLIKSDWVQIGEILKTNIDKITINGNIDIDTLHQTGYLRQYNKLFDKITYKNEKPLATSDCFSIPSTTSADPIMLDLIDKQSNDVDPNTQIIIYSTDNILTSLMTLKNSNFPYEIRVQKFNNTLILDKPNNQTSYMDLMTANENSSQNIPEEEKDMLKLCLEATNINKNLQQQVSVKGKELSLNEGQEDSEDNKKEGYKYQRFSIDNKKIQIIARCQVDSYIQNEENIQECLVRAFNEYDLEGEQWRNKFENNKGAMILELMRNNTCKLAKWLCQAELTEVQQFKLGYVSRVPTSKAESVKHAILEFETYSIKDLAQIFSFKIKDCWSIIKYIANMMKDQEDGVYMFIKAPYKPQIKVYRLPEEKEELEEY